MISKMQRNDTITESLLSIAIHESTLILIHISAKRPGYPLSLYRRTDFLKLVSLSD